MVAKSHCESSTRSYTIRRIGLCLDLCHVLEVRGISKFYVNLILRVWLHAGALNCVGSSSCDLIECISIFFTSGTLLEHSGAEYDEDTLDYSYWEGFSFFFFFFRCNFLLLLLCAILDQYGRGKGHSGSRYDGICKDLLFIRGLTSVRPRLGCSYTYVLHDLLPSIHQYYVSVLVKDSFHWMQLRSALCVHLLCLLSIEYICRHLS